MKIFHIAKLLSPDLMSRPLANDFYEYIKYSGEKEIEVDFSGVHFVTRSFMDEFYVLFSRYTSEGYSIKLFNMSSDISKTMEAVRSTQNKKKEVTDETVIKTKNIQDLERHLSTLAI